MGRLGASTGVLGKFPGLGQFAQMNKFAGIDMNQLAGPNTPSAERGSFQAPKRNLDKVKEKRNWSSGRSARTVSRALAGRERSERTRLLSGLTAG